REAATAVLSQKSEVESGKRKVASSKEENELTANRQPLAPSPQSPIPDAKALEFELLETLSALMDKSLLRVTSSGRYEQHPLTHQYAGEKLGAAADEKESIEEKHAYYYADFLQKQVTRLKGRGADQAEVL